MSMGKMRKIMEYFVCKDTLGDKSSNPEIHPPPFLNQVLGICNLSQKDDFTS